MSEKQSIQDFAEFESLIQRVIEADTNDFFEVAELLDLNPVTDLAGADLHEVDLSGGNLQGANLRWTILSGAKLVKTDLREADLSNADLSGADLSGADLTNAILKDISVENAQFIGTKGIYERIKLDLIKKGAIVENSIAESEPPKSEIPRDLNNIFERSNEDIIRDLPPLYYRLEFLISPQSEPHWTETYIEIYKPSNSSQSQQLKAIPDTGAVITCIPESAISNLGGLTYSIKKFRDLSGNIKELKTYYVNLKISEHYFQDIEVLAIPGKEYALIGRDILNKQKILFNELQGTWSIS
jgi:predicted aspartyl protease